MFERFTKPARRVVSTAVEYSQQTMAEEIRPEHLLLALLDETDSLAGRVLQAQGAPAAEVRGVLDRLRQKYVDGLDEDDAEALKALGIDLDEVVRRIERHLGGLSGARTGHRPFSRAAKKTLELALREAITLNHSYIGTEHLLLGLARCDDRVVTDTFARFGLDRGTLRAGVVEALRRAG